ncbi:MAG: zinc-ribbon domain-containing protein [Eubacteriales bacterium]
MKYCTHCQNQLEDDALFCSRCGAATDSQKNTSQGTTPPSTSPPEAKKGSSFLFSLWKGLALTFSILGFLTAFLLVGLVLDVVALALGIWACRYGKKRGLGTGVAVAAISISTASLVLCGIILALVLASSEEGFRFPWQDVRLTETTLSYGAEDYQQDLLESIDSEYTCKISDTDIDINTPGKYFVEILYVKDGKEHTKRFNVKVADTTAPSITFQNTLSNGTPYAFMDDQEGFLQSLTITDNLDGDITPTADNVKIDGIIFSMEGTNEATITVTDSAGNTREIQEQVMVVQPEISMLDYLNDFFFVEDSNVRFSTASGLSFRLDSSRDIFVGETLYLTERKHSQSQAYGSQEKGAIFVKNITFDENGIITDVESHYVLRDQSIESARVAVQHEESWSRGDQNLIGSQVYLGNFAQCENDPVIQSAGGLAFLFGKTESDLQSVMVNLKEMCVIS